jgi:serine/threonine protein kinase
MTELEGLQPGSTLGRYELLVPLAQGGTASVWAARMTGSRGFEKIVAVKVMLSEFEEEDQAESMFLDEARLVSRIKHPNVAEVLDLGEQDGALYIVMEWVDGEPLHVIVREAKAKGGLPVALAVRIVAHAAHGLHAAHELRDERGELLGLVHRDVSPQNILVSHRGGVKVIDFGVAKASSNLQRTTVGQMKGKIAFMAPEQLLSQQVDRRTDVFALGVVLYQLLTNKHPFRGDNDFVTMANTRDKRPVAPPRSLVASLPPELDAVVVKALSKPREERYPTMLEFARALDRAVPPTPDVDAELARWMGSILTDRTARKKQAIRDAIRASNERAGVQSSVGRDSARLVPDLEPPPSVDLPAAAPPLAPAAPAPPAPLAPAPAPAAPDARARRLWLVIACVALGVAILIVVLSVFPRVLSATSP